MRYYNDEHLQHGWGDKPEQKAKVKSNDHDYYLRNKDKWAKYIKNLVNRKNKDSDDDDNAQGTTIRSTKVGTKNHKTAKKAKPVIDDTKKLSKKTVNNAKRKLKGQNTTKEVSAAVAKDTVPAITKKKTVKDLGKTSSNIVKKSKKKKK